MGRRQTEETRKKISLACIGKRAWNKGIPRTEETKNKIRLTLLGKYVGEKNPMYGVHRIGKDSPMYGRHHSIETKDKIRLANMKENVGYKAIHAWVRKHLPKPEFCGHCNKIPPREIANITGILTRDINNFQWLCRSCHLNYDIKMGVR